MLHAEEGSIQGVTRLLNKNAVNDFEQKNENGNTALQLAVKNGHYSIAEILILAGANMDSINKAGQSVLFLACYEGYIDCARLLIGKGADINL